MSHPLRSPPAETSHGDAQPHANHDQGDPMTDTDSLRRRLAAAEPMTEFYRRMAAARERSAA